MAFESLDGSDWDVVIAGTGIHESLLALALSRSNKKVLHVDKNSYYGGANAALSLQDAEQWVAQVNQGPETYLSCFSRASINTPNPDSSGSGGGQPTPKLGSPRAYSLALSPDLIYARSSLLPTLVSAKVDEQLEFLAMGRWWLYSDIASDSQTHNDDNSSPRLQKVPSGREDLFADTSIDLKSKRSLTRFLRFVADYENQADTWEPHRQTAFGTFLETQFKIPPPVQQPIHALVMTLQPLSRTTTELALPRIARHLRSIGVFGPGFGAVIPKWGGLAEIAQVGCRAGAVGGGVYVLGQGVEEVESLHKPDTNAASTGTRRALRIKLSKSANSAVADDSNGKEESEHIITGDYLVCGPDNVFNSKTPSKNDEQTTDVFSRSVTIVGSALSSLFPPLSDSSPTPAGAVVCLSSSGLMGTGDLSDRPVYIVVHSSDTGECPAGQCVLYASIAAPGDIGFGVLEKAVAAMLRSVSSKGLAPVLWQVQYEQNVRSTAPNMERIYNFPPPSLDLSVDDIVLSRVEVVWKAVAGDEAGEFMRFPKREDKEEDNDD